MKNTRAMLAPVNTRKMLAMDRPMTAANSQKVSWAALTLMLWMRALRKNTKPRGASITTHLSGVVKIGTYSAGVAATRNATAPVIARPRPM
jgi:hypothetical protein